MASKQMCQEKSSQLYVSKAEDRIGDRPLCLVECFAIAKKQTSDLGKNDDRSRLADSVLVAVGLKVMVTSNIDLRQHIANGARGVIVEIIMDPREEISDGQQDCIELSYPPACVLLKMNGTLGDDVGNLETGIVPIFPIQKSLSWYDLPSFLSCLCLCPAPSLSPSDSIRPHLPAFHRLRSNSEVYSCNYATSVLGLALD